MDKIDQLSIPPAAHRGSKAFEIVRVWIVDGDLHVSMNPLLSEDPAVWGILLTDLARHVADAHEEGAGRDPKETLSRIRAGWDAEFDSPTDVPSGHLLEE